MTALSPRLAHLLALALSTATIAGAWGFQLIGGYLPCPLCYQQRWPYYIGIPLLVGALVLAQAGRAGGASLGLAVAALVFAYGLYLGGFQAGAEWGFWPGPRDCAGGSGGIPMQAGDLLTAMAGTKLVSCTQVQLRIFGLSFAGWNAVVSAALVALVAHAAWHGRRAQA